MGVLGDHPQFPVRSFDQELGVSVLSFTTNGSSNPAAAGIVDRGKLIDTLVRSSLGKFKLTLRNKAVDVRAIAQVRGSSDFRVDVHAVTEGNTPAILDLTVKCRAEPYQHRHPGGVAAGTDFTEYLARIPEARSLKSAYLCPDAALTADDTDYATLDLCKANGAGGALTVLGTINTKITGGTGDWVAGTLIELPSVAADALAAGEVLALRKAKTGNGVAIPALGLYVDNDVLTDLASSVIDVFLFTTRRA